jgi:hypothetical protein
VHFCLQPCALFTLLLPFAHYLFLALDEYQPKVYSTLLFFPYYSNLLLLRRRRWTGILWRGLLRYVLPRLPFLWSYGVFHCSISLRVIIVFRVIIYVIIILYSWHLVICEDFWPYVWNNWCWVMHTMSTWLWHKNRLWQKWYQSCVNRRNTSPVRRVLFLFLFSSICESILF